MADAMAVRMVNASARTIPTVASFGAMCPLLATRQMSPCRTLEGLNGKMCERLHTSAVVQKMWHGNANAIRSALGLSANHINLVGEMFGGTRAGTLHQPTPPTPGS